MLSVQDQQERNKSSRTEGLLVLISLFSFGAALISAFLLLVG